MASLFLHIPFPYFDALYRALGDARLMFRSNVSIDYSVAIQSIKEARSWQLESLEAELIIAVHSSFGVYSSE